MLKPAFFLDRDGVINEESGYVHKIIDFKWIPGSKEAIKYLNKKNYFVFVVTNQSGIARGYYSEDDVLKLHNYINNELLKINAHIDDFFYSPYHPDFPNKYSHLSNLRKPNSGMLELAQKKWNFDKSRSLMVGDQKSDLSCARKFGINGYLFNQKNLFEFIKKINF